MTPPARGFFLPEHMKLPEAKYLSRNVIWSSRYF
jgi:hypothetical protein